MNLQALPEDALKEILALTEAKRKLDIREQAITNFVFRVHLSGLSELNIAVRVKNFQIDPGLACGSVSRAI